MTEQSIERVNQDELLASFEDLSVRPSLMEGFIGAGAVGARVPTLRSWQAEKPQAIGKTIKQILAEDEMAFRVYALDDSVIRRRNPPKPNPFTRIRHATWMRGPFLKYAEVTEVIDTKLGLGRILPVLKLEPFGNPPPKGDFVISLPDLAHYVQKGNVEVTLT